MDHFNMVHVYEKETSGKQYNCSNGHDAFLLSPNLEKLQLLKYMLQGMFLINNQGHYLVGKGMFVTSLHLLGYVFDNICIFFFGMYKNVYHIYSETNTRAQCISDIQSIIIAILSDITCTILLLRKAITAQYKNSRAFDYHRTLGKQPSIRNQLLT